MQGPNDEIIVLRTGPLIVQASSKPLAFPTPTEWQQIPSLFAFYFRVFLCL